MTDSDALTARQLKSLPFILGSATNEEAARRARVSRQTLYTWLAQPAFRNELRRQRAALVSDALDRLKGGMGESVGVLFELLRSVNEQVRRGAANDMLRVGLRVMELQELEDRMSRLEQRFEEQARQCQ